MPSTVSAMGRTAMRLACGLVSWKCLVYIAEQETHVFDVRARVDGDDIAVLDAQVVADHSVYPRRAIIEVVVGKHNEHCVLALLALDQDRVATEQLERLHGVVGESDNGVVIVDGIGHAIEGVSRGGYSDGDECGRDLHERVWLLLLLEDGCGRLVYLWRVSKSRLR